MDGTSGREVWKSRPPGGSGLILVDGHLAILGKGVELVLARATAEDYVERARIQALAAGSVTYPSHAGGVLFVRDTREIAAVRVRPGPAVAAPDASPGTGALAALATAVAAAEVKRAPVDAFTRAHPALPLVGEGRIDFVWRGSAKDVTVEASHLGWSEEPMVRLPGTDLWYRSDEVPAGTRIEYRFNVDFEQVGPDPANPWRVPAEWGADYSVVVVPPRSEPPPARARADQPTRGRLETFVHASALLGNERTVQLWLPEGEARALALATEGAAWIEKGLLLDVARSAGGGVAVAFVGSPAEGGEDELGGARTSAYVRMLADELIPALAQRYGVRAPAAGTAVLGRWRGGLAAIAAGLERPPVFGRVFAASVLGRDERDALVERIGAGPASDVHFRLTWNRFERWDGAETTRALYDALAAAGRAPAGGERNDSAGWAAWRAQAAEALAAFFP